MLFVGSFPHHPNRDAAHWLVEEIMPLVRLEDPDILTYIVGSSPTEDILRPRERQRADPRLGS